MASRHSEYRDSKGNCSDESSSSAIVESEEEKIEDVNDSTIKYPSGFRNKKNYIIESSDEDSEDENFHNRLQSTHISGCEASLPELSDEEIFSDSDYKISDVSVKHQTSPETAVSDHIVFDSDEKQQNTSHLKPRKSARISLALNKLLNIDSEVVKEAGDETLKDTSNDIFASDNKDPFTEQEGAVLNDDDLVISSSFDSVNDNKSVLKSDEQYNKQIHDDSVVHFTTSDESDGGNTEVKKTSDSVVHFTTSDESDGGNTEVKKISDSVVHFTTSDESDGGNTEVKKTPDSVVHFTTSDESEREDDNIEVRKTEQKDQSKEIGKMQSVHHVPDIQVVDLVKKEEEINGISCIDLTDETSKHLQPGSSQNNIHQNKKLDNLISASTSEIGKVEMQKISRQKLQDEISILTKDIEKLKKTFKCVDVSKLPDKGIKLQMKFQESIELLKIKERELAAMPVIPTTEENNTGGTIKNPVVHRLPPGYGVQALKKQIQEKTLTEEALTDLHGSISTCPTEDVMADSPLGLKSAVELMPHQKHALAWLSWRETQKPSGGILADDMGLGKTLTMISLVLKAKEHNDSKSDDNVGEEENDEELGGYPLGGTLVICPASLLHQWEDEIKKHCKRGVLDVEIHHGSGREENARSLARNDIVISTYSIVRTSANKGGKEQSVKRSRRGVLHRVRWRRIILDEAHTVRNHKSQQSIAVCMLMGRKRWALTGTPIHNKELDLYALLKFLRCSPFDDYYVWRRWVDNKNTAGIKRLNTLINAIMLRRTKDILIRKKELGDLPEKSLVEILVKLNKDEFNVYTKILWFSKTLFAQYLSQKAERDQLQFPVFSKPSSKKPEGENHFANNPELQRMFDKFQQMGDIKTHEILVLLLRLRQICVHPGLIKAMLDKEVDEIAEIDADANDLLSKMESMTLRESSEMHFEEEAEENGEKEMDVLRANNPVFDLTRVSSKMKAIFEILEEKILNTSDKAIIVSQWTSMLNVLYDHLKDAGVKCDILSGAVPVKDRMEIVSRFNRTGGSFQVLLLSLTAGGVGLNLTGANHLFMVDLHWNPQLECQAFDRIYRVGQKKPVYIYKFICQETIEERIKLLQDKKMAVASSVLSGTMQKNNSKLTLDDLKTLFSM